MAGSGANGKLLAMGLLLTVVAVGLVVADRETDHFSKVKVWTDRMVGHASTSITVPKF
jgi:hypothetical protein